MSFTANRREWVPDSEIDRREVKDELERVLASAPFRGSRRYPSLLRYVVEKHLSGDGVDLKERTLGIEVFHRAADYDTNADPVVRFSAGEVRRRLAQYYQESPSKSSIKITLPSGSYLPVFLRIETAEEELSAHPGDVEHFHGESDSGGHGSRDNAGAVHASEDRRGSIASDRRRDFFAGILAGVVAISCLMIVGYFFARSLPPRSAKNPVTEVWGPLISSSDAVMISVGRTHVDNTDPVEPPNATIEQHILRPDARISLAAVQAVAQVAGLLESEHKQFSVHEAYSTTLQDLHRHPVTLVSGYNNIWTMRLLQPLPFRLESTGSLHYIVDAQHPERRDWSVDFDTPYLQQTVDYAIVGRFYDPTTDGPIVVVAGIGSNGSIAAGEFVVSPDALQALARTAPLGTLDQNFEVVLKVEVIGGNTGAATVVASRFW